MSIHPVTWWLVGVIVGILGISPLVFLAIGKKISDKLRDDLWTRWRSWLILAPLMIGPIIIGRLAAIVGVGILGIMCYREFARATGFFRNRLESAVVALGIVLLTFASADHWNGFFHALVSLIASLIVIVALASDQPKGYIQRVALGVFAFLLFGVCLGHFGSFANDHFGQPLMLAIVLLVQMNDVFAYCTGKLFGHRKLCPNTSPNKTIGGAIGATVLTTAATAGIFHCILRNTAVDHWGHLLAMGFVLSLSGQWGDLVMSSIKRDLGIKDMAALIPGHGGLLDRFDSLLFVGPALFHYINYFHGVGLDQPVRIFSGT